ncbi:hypothetical protein RSOLAG22IIIB_07488 [Rhizoctonia solani]|uniref:Laminin domain protein n=1 Tax=Rhizoctonia solani TaxID=456999 RepID=A0A0K6FMX8_9AGAM|nr:hypothetical protein RSOLAG22IIIB_07488 [Rhizoctonia solani]
MYTPPVLPTHISVLLGPVKGMPSNEEIIRVQAAIRLYQQYSNVPSLFDPHLDVELSQHLFDLQMAKYRQRVRNKQSDLVSCEHSSSSPARIVEKNADNIKLPNADANNAELPIRNAEVHASARPAYYVGIPDTLKQSNGIAEHANRLIEHSNRLVEHSNQLLEQAVERSNRAAGQFNKLLERLNQHDHKQLNFLAEESINPADKLEGILKNINKVLVKIQHAIIRSHKGNTIAALDCLVNEEGETPGTRDTAQASAVTMPFEPARMPSAGSYKRR